jgi:hypothetical protein
MRNINNLPLLFVDSEFNAHKGRGKRPGFPHCICAIKRMPDGAEIEYRVRAPYPARPPWDDGTPYAAIVFSGGAEAGSFLHVPWPFPVLTIDLYAEYMTIHNTEMCRGEDKKEPGPSLLEACARYRVVGMDARYKTEMRQLSYEKDDHTPAELDTLEGYCLEDGRAGMRLYDAMAPSIDFPRALIRGRFMWDLGRMNWYGLPIDVETYRRFQRQRLRVIAKMQRELNEALGAEIYYNGVFKRNEVFRFMLRNKIPIPIHPKTRKPTIERKYLKSMVEAFPPLKTYYRNTKIIDALSDLSLEIGDDNRNRFWANPFATKTGRNAPSGNKNLFGLPFTMRCLFKPETDTAIAQVDYGSQEIGIAAFLSKDPQLIHDYLSGDVYEAFAANALGILKPTAQQRQIYKACTLGRIYGQGAPALARNLGITLSHAYRIMDQLDERYPVLNAWLNRVVTKAAHCIPITCVHGWSLTATGRKGEERTFLNFPMQANAAECMRLVVVRASAAGLRLIGVAHDSFLIEAPIDQIEQHVARLQEIMHGVSRDLFGGELRADCKPEDIVRYPDRFADKRERETGMANWNRLLALIADAEQEEENGGSSRTGERCSGVAEETRPQV